MRALLEITSACRSHARVLKGDTEIEDTVPVNNLTGFQVGERFVPCDSAFMLGVTRLPESGWGV